MSQKNQHSKQYSALDIQRYLKGQMSVEEMHAIETAALEDPFLADAIEGFETALAQGNEEEITVGINKLNKEFSQRIHRPARVVPMSQSRWWQVAAIASILVITGVAFYNNWIKPEQKATSLAVIDSKAGDSLKRQARESTSAKSLVDSFPTSPIPTNQSSEPAGIVSPSVTNKPQNESDSKSAEKRTETVVSSPEKKQVEIVSQEAGQLEKSKDASISPPLAAGTDTRQKDQVSIANAEPIARRNEQLSQQLNNFSGRVVDENNKPLANANLQILSNKGRVLTDQSGSFQFTDKDSIADVQVTLSGFEQRNFRLQNNIASNKIVLEPQKATMDEVVVTGYGTQRKKGVTKTSVRVQDAVPQIGWIEYEKYIERNKKPPSSNPLMKGEVVVSFQIKRPAVLSDFKIEKSLSKDYDAEAIRLVREGPAWKLLRGYRTRITVIINY